MTRCFKKSVLYDNHKEYEKREYLSVDYIINKDVVKVRIPEASTLLVNMTRKEYIDETSIRNLIKDFKEKAREQGVKLKGINKLTQYVNDSYHDYFRNFKKYDELFDEFVILWENHVNHFRTGYRDDVIYQNVLSRYPNVINNMWNRNGALYRITDYYYKMQNLLESMDRNTYKQIDV